MEALDGGARGSELRRWVSAAVAAILLGAAVWMVASHREAVDAAFGHALRAGPALIALALLLPAANFALITLSFWILNNNYARVELKEMGALIASAWLLNYLPLRPGMIARLAYHKKRHGITIRQSMWVYVVSTGLTGVSIALSLAIALLLGPGVDPALAALALLLPAVAGLALAIGAGGRAQPGLSRLLAVFALRHADMLVWVARYAVIFAIIGVPLSTAEAVAIAIVSQIALLIPIAGNGLGLREWAIGLTAGLLPAFAGGSPTATGLAGELAHRGFEVVSALALGVPALIWLSRRLARGADKNPPAPASESA